MKKHRTVTSVLLIFFFISELAAQEVGTSWGVQVFPNYSYRKLVPVNNTVEQSLLFEIGEMEQGKFSYSGGFVAEFHWGSKVGFQTGINYHHTGYQTVRMPFTSNDGTESEEQIAFKYLSLEVPFVLNFYQEFTPKTRMYFIMGGTGAVNLNNQMTTTIYNGKESIGRSSTAKIEAKNNPVAFSLLMGMGVEQFVSDQMSVFLQPSFQFFLQPFIQDAELARIPFGVGISVGFKFRPSVIE